MSGKKQFISPISVDLGAKNTGVYFAHYSAGSSLNEIKNKKGKVYQLEKDNYTFLMETRTANRHQKRGLDRRQMVKRLFKLIWTKHFQLEWSNDIQQVISFLLNRRGFTFLTEQYDSEVLKEFPSEIINHKDFPTNLQEKLAPDKSNTDSHSQIEYVNLQEKIEELSKNKEDLEEVIELLKKKKKEINRPLYVLDRIKSLKNYCEKRKKDIAKKIKESDKDKAKLSELPEWVLKEWEKKGIKDFKLENESQKNIDIVDYLNELSAEKINKILNSIPDTSNEEKNLKNSIWNTQIKKFSLEKADFSKPEQEKEKLKWIQTHLQHLGFALDKIYQEIESGGRYRSKYFEEIKEVLKNNYSDKSPKYLKNFCDNLRSGSYAPLDQEKLKNLMGHLSNFELNLLRSYFNDRSHIKSDQWSEKKLNKKFKHWIIKIWRVNPEKDRDKTNTRDYSYNKLKKKLKNNGNIINDFFLKEDPNWTIPPYQDKDNRHPPKCQSLILNTNYLDQHYKDWENWLEELKKEVSDYIGDYERQLKSLKSSKDKIYFEHKIENNLKKDYGKRTEKDFKARLLQFIFDRIKKEDHLKLNQIFSHIKKIRQNLRDDKSIEKEKKELENSISNSKLPEKLKTKPDFNSEDIFKQNQFLHLICKYYKLRQKAKDGRLFIHPKYRYIKNRGYENTGRFDDKNQILTYCNHKPRRKKYQTFEDLSSALQISSKKLREKIKDSDELIKKLKEIIGLENSCSEIATQQKNRKGLLKLHIQVIYHSICKNLEQNIKTNQDLTKKKKEKFIKGILKELDIKEAYKLYKLCEKSKTLYMELLEKLDQPDNNKKQIVEKSLEENPASAFYLLAQINNIAFKERNGNAKTCPVCSMDNSERMQTNFNSSNQFFSNAKASRLPAIPTRIIDGAVMRMTRVLTKAIAEEKWKDIKNHLKKNEKISIPIITESNQFEFEPSREDLVKKQRKRVRRGKILSREEGFNLFEKKENRIKTKNKICPYTGKNILSDKGEIDHIIPRKSKYGTLNDEANLIWASVEGNKNKDNKDYGLSNLTTNYKKELFKTENDTEITDWIKDTIWNEETKDFKFGKYTNFINLNPDEQTAFRHALFLRGDSLRDKVIQAIDNRNRSFVNGTQRYFAETLVNEFYKKAKKEKQQHLLSFDYFSSPAEEIHEIRKGMEKIKENEELLHPELKEYEKEKNKIQESYSHLIDAQIAFISSVSKHYNEGSFKIKAQAIDVYKDYKIIKVSDKDFDAKEELKRKSIKPKDKKISHRQIFNSNAGAWHFLKLIEIKINDSSHHLIGFLDFKKLNECLNKRDWPEIKKEIKDSYCPEKRPIARLLENKDKEIIKLYQIGEGKHEFGYQKNRKYPKMILGKKWDSYSKESHSSSVSNIKVFLHQINKTKVAEFLLENFNTNSDPSKWKKEDCQVLDQLTKVWYHTKKKKIKKENIQPNSEKIDNFKIQKLFNPSLFYAWKKLNEEWKKEKSEKDFNSFLKEYFKDKTSKHSHKKVRKNFSLPISASGQGWFLVKRRVWDKDKYPYIYQCLSEENIPKFGSHRTSLKEALYSHFRQNNLFLFPKSNKKSKNLKEKLYPVDDIIDPDTYFDRKVPNDLKNILEKIQNKTAQDSKRAYFCFTFKQKPDLDINLIKIIKKFPTRDIKDITNSDIFFDKLEKTNNIQLYIENKKQEIVKEKEKNQEIIKSGNQDMKEKAKEKNKEIDNELKFYSKIKSLYNKLNKNILEYQANMPFKRI